jgi:hypothetical protein
MKNTIKSLLITLFLAGTVASNSINKMVTVFSEVITNRFIVQSINTPQEKVYLQTDKPYYSAGEDLWFKAYLVNAVTLIPNAGSQFIYVELIDKSDSVFYRVKIRKDSLGFSGRLKLKPELPSGYYALRAYTNLMQNTDNDFFFKKNILIGNDIDDRVTSKITYGTPTDGLIPVTITFTDASLNPVSGKRVEILQNWTGILKKRMYMDTNKEGKINWKLSADSKGNAEKSIEVNMEDVKYNKNFYIPEFSGDFDVQFFPESGVLLNNDLQLMAFKAIGKDGLSVDVTGRIFTDQNEEISMFTTSHKGMGKFSIQTQPNRSYYALVKDAEGLEKRFELPKTEAEAVAIHLRYIRDKILYEVVNQTSIPNQSLWLLVHSRGKVFVIQPLNSPEGQIAESMLPPGIVSFSVIDSLGHTFCERLSFVRNNASPVVSMESNKSSYGKRELVDLSLNIHSAFEEPVNGNFSISITDSHTVKLDSLADNIQSNLLLSSDIKGYIEDPAAYFVDNETATREKTDVLLMTQGWRRFNTADIVKAVYRKPVYNMEVEQTLSGKVLNAFNKPSKKCDVIMFSPYRNMVVTAVTDSLGRYLIDGIEYPDSTRFILKAKKSKGISDVVIVPNTDEFPKPDVFIPTPLISKVPAPDDYFKQSKEKYYYEGGIRVVNLSEVTVSANKKPDSKMYYYTGKANAGLTLKDLERYPGMDVLNLLQTIPGVAVQGDQISVRGPGTNPFSPNVNPLFLIDGMVAKDIRDILWLSTNNIQKIEVFKGASASIFGSDGMYGAIAIYLKPIDFKTINPIYSEAHVIPLGYQKPAQFYVPKYKVESVLNSAKPDLRTTIYWNPKLVADINGNVHVKFYTADNANDYSVVFEGLTNNGEICRYVGILKRGDK